MLLAIVRLLLDPLLKSRQTAFVVPLVSNLFPNILVSLAELVVLALSDVFFHVLFRKSPPNPVKSNPVWFMTKFRSNPNAMSFITVFRW